MKKIVSITKPTVSSIDVKIKTTMLRIVELIRIKHLS